MIVTVKWLREQNACENGVDRFIKLYGKQKELKTVINGHIKDNTLDYANWLLARKMTHKQQIKYAIFAAEQVLYLYEEKYKDDRPRKAIEAAKAVLKKNNIENKNAAYAAATAADAAANAAANAAYTAAKAADAAAYAAYAAATAAYTAYAANAAYTAANTAYTAYTAADAAADTAYTAMKIKIIKYGLKLIYK
jgi:hypothetical protein